MAAIIFYIFSFFLLTSAVAVIFARNPVHSVLFLILAFFNAAGLFILLGAEFLAMLLVIVYVGAVAVLFLFVVMMLDIVPKKETMWFSEKKWFVFKKGLRDGALYLAIWLPSFMVLLSGMYLVSLPSQGLPTPSFSILDLTNSGVFSQLYASFPQLPMLVKTVILILSVFLASQITTAVTKIFFFNILERLFRGLPVPFIVGCILIAELVAMLSCWNSPILPIHALNPVTEITASISNTHALAPYLYKDYVLAFILSGLILLVAMIGAIVLTLHKRTDTKRQDIARQLARRKEDTLEICKVKTGEGI